MNWDSLWPSEAETASNERFWPHLRKTLIHAVLPHILGWWAKQTTFGRKKRFAVSQTLLEGSGYRQRHFALWKWNFILLPTGKIPGRCAFNAAKKGSLSSWKLDEVEYWFVFLQTKTHPYVCRYLYYVGVSRKTIWSKFPNELITAVLSVGWEQKKKDFLGGVRHFWGFDLRSSASLGGARVRVHVYIRLPH